MVLSVLKSEHWRWCATQADIAPSFARLYASVPTRMLKGYIENDSSTDEITVNAVVDYTPHTKAVHSSAKTSRGFQMIVKIWCSSWTIVFHNKIPPSKPRSRVSLECAITFWKISSDSVQNCRLNIPWVTWFDNERTTFASCIDVIFQFSMLSVTFLFVYMW